MISALAGALMLWIALGPHDVADNYTETDFLGGYVEGARGIQAGRLDPARYAVVGPVYEVTLALAGFVTRDLLLAGKLISVAAACGTLLLWFLLVERRAGAVAGFWTLSFLAVNPILVRYGSSTTTDALATFAQAAAVLFLFGREGRRAPLWAGVLAGVAVLTRYNAIYLLPAEFSAPRPARLYRIEPGFGAAPAWLASDSLRTLRVARALGSIGAPLWRAALVSGLYALDQKDFTAAARHFAALTRIRPDFAQGFFLAGEAHRNLGELAAAAEAYTRAISLDPNHLDARLAREAIARRAPPGGSRP